MAIVLDGTNASSFSGKLTKPSLPTGSVLQVINATYSTHTTNNTSTMADTGLTATITPTNATSKILVIVNHADVAKTTNDTSVRIKLVRNGTDILTFARYSSSTGSILTSITQAGTSYLDSPATTSAVTYKTQFASNSNNASAIINFGGESNSTITLMEIAA